MALYNKDTDYRKLIDEAAGRGDFGAAAQYEQQRNDKITGEGLGQKTTSDYIGNLDKTDYGGQIKNMISGGASANDVRGVLDKRTSKANSTLNLSKYAYDDIYKSAMDYIGSKKPTYTSKYSGQIDSIVNQIMNGSFDDYLKSDDYASLAKEYTAKGKKAMQDTTADVAARTGGLASSYAVTAGTQTNDAFMSELQNMAREMYGQKTDALYKQADLLQALDAGDYNKYLGLLDQYNTENQLDYNRGRDTLSDQRYEDETKYNRQQDAYTKQASIAETMAGIGDFSGLKALGYTDDQIKKLTQNFIAEQQAAATKKSSGGKKSSSSTTTYPKIAKYNQQYNGTTKNLNKSSLDYSEDEGIFTWNGKSYNTTGLTAALEKADKSGQLTANDKAALTKKFKMYGFENPFA